MQVFQLPELWRRLALDYDAQRDESSDAAHRIQCDAIAQTLRMLAGDLEIALQCGDRCARDESTTTVLGGK